MNKNKLTGFVLFALMLCMGGASLKAQRVQYAENAQKKGFQLQSSQKRAIILSHNVSSFSMTNVNVEGEIMKQLHHGLDLVPAEAGMPDLKIASTALLIPRGAQVRIRVLNEVKEIYNGIDIAPAAPLPLDNEDAKPAVKGKAYQQDTFFPEQRYVADVQEVRGASIAYITVAPFSYNPVERQLVVYKNIDLEIEILGGDKEAEYIAPRFRSKQWDAIIRDMILNKQDLPKIDYSKVKQTNKAEGCEYLVVVPDDADFVQWADSIKRFRNEQGIYTKVVTVSEIGGNTLDQIKDYVQNIYNTWNPVPSAILLMADYGNDDKTITSKSYEHPYLETYITDNYYADCTGNDLPDITFARITARNAQDLEIMLHKFLDYERTPPTDVDFYNKPITALGWQTERWFQICSEVVGGYMHNTLGKDPQRVNAVHDGDPVTDPWSTATNTAEVIDYFGPDGQGYIPATPGELGDWSGGTASDVVNAINQGAFILQHRDHGFEQGWGEPDFSSSYIAQLNNSDKLTHVFSINCLTGRFDYNTDCFVEKMHRYNNGGALSMTAATQVSYSFVNDTYVWGMFDNMWPDFLPDYGEETSERDFMPAFGSVGGKYFLQSSSWPYNTDSKQITYRLFHHHGDAFGSIYTEVPQNLTPQYEEVVLVGNTNFQISNLPQGALVGLSVDGECIGGGYADATGVAEVDYAFQESGTSIKVVVTKQNYYRYTASVMVITPEGPYVIKNAFTINDDLGNNNQLADYGEDIKLNFSLKNVGAEVANNVNISIASDDQYVNITDATEDFGIIAADEIMEKQNAFALKVANNVPDQHNVPINYVVTDGTNEWEGSFFIKIQAPALECPSFTVEEVGGNGNGFVDPGEDVKLSFTIQNNGHSLSLPGTANLGSPSDDISFVSSAFEMEALETEASTVIEAMATVDMEAQLGISIPVNISILSGEYAVAHDVSFVSGLVIEDWETGDLSRFDWQLSGDANWTIDDSVMHGGNYSLKSGTITHSQSTEMSISYSVQEDSEIRFFYKTSSESNYDELRFYIDGTQKGQWSGETAWTELSFEVSQGEHTFEWVYSKDGSMTDGQDCVWLDDIILPPMSLPTVAVGEDIQLCKTETQYQLDAQANNYNSLVWTTNGDGAFSEEDVLNPIYTFGPQDMANGEVELRLEAIGDNGSATSNIIIYLVDMPETPIVEGAAAVCQAAENEVYILGGDGIGTYNCAISPANAATLVVQNNIATVSFADNFVGEAQLSVNVANTCGTSETINYAIQVNTLSTVEFSQDNVYACQEESTATAQINISGNEATPWEVQVVGDNGFNQSFTVDQTPFDIELPVVNNITHYNLQSISDANGCEGSAMGTLNLIKSDELTPVVSFGTYDTICRDQIVVLEAPEGQGYTYLWSNGSTSRTLEVSYTMAVDNVFRASVEVSNTAGCSGSDAVDIVFKSCVGIAEYEANKIVLMPNPNDGNFLLDISAISREVEQVSICSIVGAKVADIDIQKGKDRFLVQKSDLQSGMYLLRIITTDGLLMSKSFIVK